MGKFGEQVAVAIVSGLAIWAITRFLFNDKDNATEGETGVTTQPEPEPTDGEQSAQFVDGQGGM